MRILREVFGLFDKRGASGGGTPYIIRGAWGLGAYKGAAERRLTGGRKYAPKGNGKDEKEKKQSALPYLIIDGEGTYYQKLIRATLLVAWGLQNQ